jgi:hypothetical protein
MFELNVYELAIGMILQIHEGHEAYISGFILPESSTGFTSINQILVISSVDVQNVYIYFEICISIRGYLYGGKPGYSGLEGKSLFPKRILAQL